MEQVNKNTSAENHPLTQPLQLNARANSQNQTDGAISEFTRKSLIFSFVAGLIIATWEMRNISNILPTNPPLFSEVDVQLVIYFLALAVAAVCMANFILIKETKR